MLENTGTVTWVSSGGGPLILLSREHAPNWEGCDPPSGGRVVEADFRWDKKSDPATDYDRACDVKDYMALVDVGRGQGLVLWAEPAATTWWPHDQKDKTEGILVRWIYADSEASVRESLARIPVGIWKPTDLVFSVGTALLYLFDAAYPGRGLEECLLIKLRAGNYSIMTAEFKPDEKTFLVLHKLSLLSA